MGEPLAFNVHDGVPNLRGGLSETTKWLLGTLIALAALLGGPLSTLVKATQNENWAQYTKDMAGLREEVHLLKQASENHIGIENEVQKRRDIEFEDLKELIKKGKH